MSTVKGETNTYVVLKDDGIPKISIFRDITSENLNQIFEQNGYKLTIYYIEKKWALSMPKHFSGRRTLNMASARCVDGKENCWSVHVDRFCFLNEK
ncbi:hypothetical protein BB559_006451 [Furculomyces boomerangus]|nr:hypothetical protein BB559_006451 [Furculomyces boomerangus]PWA00723.1 hypothetical protein BB558_003200 [Smittium angustum]